MQIKCFRSRVYLLYKIYNMQYINIARRRGITKYYLYYLYFRCTNAFEYTRYSTTRFMNEMKRVYLTIYLLR